MRKIVTIIPTLEIGGAESLVISLLTNYNHKKEKIILIMLFNKDKNLYEDILSKYPIEIIYMNKRNGADLSLFFSLYKILNKIQPDIIHTHLYSSSYVLPWKVFHNNVFWYHTVHSVAEKELYSFHIKLMKIAYYFNLAQPVAISDLIKKSIIDFYNVSENRVKTIYNGINLENYKVDKKQYFFNDKINLVSVGRLTTVKNHMMLLRVLKKINNNKFSLTIVGGGDQKNILNKYIIDNNLGDMVKMVGETNNVVNYLKLADIFVLTSIYEGLPISIIEAMAAGLPIVSSDVGGVSDIVKNEVNGFLFNKDDDEALEKILINYLNNKSLIENQGIYNKKDCQKYDIKIIAKKYEDLFLNYDK